MAALDRLAEGFQRPGPAMAGLDRTLPRLPRTGNTMRFCFGITSRHIDESAEQITLRRTYRADLAVDCSDVVLEMLMAASPDMKGSVGVTYFEQVFCMV